MGVMFTPYESVRRFPSLSQCCQRSQSRIALQRQTTTILSKTREPPQCTSIQFWKTTPNLSKNRVDSGGVRIRSTELLR